MSSPSLRRTLPLTHYWHSERGLTALLLSLTLLIFLVLPLETSGLIGPGWMVVVDVWLVGVVFAGAAAVGWHTLQRWLVGVGFALLAALLAFRLVARSIPSPWTEGISASLSVVLVSFLVALIVARVFREGRASSDRIYGAVAAYLLVGLDWALAYRLVDVLVPGSFHGLAWAPASHNLADFSYFSLATLTTVGYGDVVPLSLPARSLCNLEGIVGQLFPAIFLARLVSLPRTPAQE